MLRFKYYRSSILWLIGFWITSANFMPSQTAFYRLETSSTGRFLSDAGESKQLQAGIGVVDEKKSWKFVIVDNGSYKIVCNGSDNVVTASDAQSSIITGEKWQGTNGQKWILEHQHGNMFRIKNVATLLYLTANHEMENGTDPNPDVRYYKGTHSVGQIIQAVWESRDVQIWHIAEVHAIPREGISVSYVGWRPSQKKNIVLGVYVQLIHAPEFIVTTKEKQKVMNGTMIYSGSLWNQYYYVADLSQLSIPGDYNISTLTYWSSFKISEDVFTHIRGENGILSFAEMLNGFWAYNHFYSQTIEEATLDPYSKILSPTGKYFNLPAVGWYDANSRDSKTSRTAAALLHLCYASLATNSTFRRNNLTQEILYILGYFSFSQATDGSWPMGKIRKDSTTYYWVIDADTGLIAKTVRALVVASDALKSDYPSEAKLAMKMARLGWNYAKANQKATDFHWNVSISFSGGTVDLMNAAIELALATNEQEFFDAANQFIMSGRFVNGVWQKINGSFPRQYTNPKDELVVSSVTSLCRYYTIVKSAIVQNHIIEQVSNWAIYWKKMKLSPHGIPISLVTGGYGMLATMIQLAASAIHVGETFEDLELMELTSAIFSWATGCNPFSSSFLIGFGDESSINSFFLRSFNKSMGAVLPGFVKNPNTGGLINHEGDYHCTEGTVIGSAPIFDVVVRLNNCIFSGKNKLH